MTAIVPRPDGSELVLRGHSDSVTSAHFSPNGEYVVTASRDHVPIVWDARRGGALRKLRGHFAVVSDARFSPDGRWIVTGWTAEAWAFRGIDRRAHLSPPGPRRPRLVRGFDPTSKRIVTGSRDGTLQTYRCTICGHLDELVPLARARLSAADPT